MELQVVTLVCENAACGEQMAALGHVKRLVSWFLLDFHAIPLAEAVKHKDLALFDLLTGTGEEHLGKGLDDTQLVSCMKVAIQSDLVVFFEALMTGGSVCWYPEWFRSGEMVEMAARQGSLLFLQSLHRHRPSWLSSKAMIPAAGRGHLAIVKFLVDKRLDAFASAAAAQALGHDHREVAQYLLQHCEIRCSPCLMVQAIRMGRFRSASWLCQLDGSELLGISRKRRCSCHSSWTPASFESMLKQLEKFPGEVIEYSLIELQWLQEHFPHIHLKMYEKMVVLAAANSNLARVQWLMEKGVDPRDTDTLTLQEAMQIACRRGRLDVVKCLVRHHQKVPFLDEAVEGGNLALVKFLQDECLVVGFRNLHEALDEAACNGHVKVVQRFESCRQMPYPAEAYYRAARAGRLAMLRFLIARPHDDQVLVRALKAGLEGGHLSVVKLLHAEMVRHDNHGALIKKFWGSPLGWEVERKGTRRYLDALCFLLFRELHRKHETHGFMWVYMAAIRLAMKWRDVRLLQQLHRGFTEPFSNVHSFSWVEIGSLAIAKFFLHAVPQQPHSSAIHQAAANGNLPLIDFLHRQCGQECTIAAMESAAKRGHWKVVRFLHQHQATPSDLSGVMTAAIQYNQLQVVKYLWSLKDQLYDAKKLVVVACVSCCLALVAWLVENNDGTLDDGAYEEALSTARRNGLADAEQKRQTIAFLESRRSELCSKRRRMGR